jgi:outer membrane cobalamin receptor
MKKQGQSTQVSLLTRLLGMLCFVQPIYGQEVLDSMKVKMETLVVHEFFSNPTEKAKLQVLDSGIVQAKSLTISTLHSSDWINRSHPSINIKNYGPSSSSTLSVRGSSANQTQLLWHNLNINQSWQSLSDLSLIPSGFFEGIQLSSSSLVGLVAGIPPGASLLLQPKTIKSDTTFLEIGYTVGSFDLHKVLGTFGFSRKGWNSLTSIQYFQAQNDFPYTNSYKKNNPIEKLSHAANQHLSILHESKFLLDSINRLDFGFWLVKNYRELPPTMLMSSSVALQKDLSYRSFLGWNFQKKKWKGINQIAYFSDKLIYQDSIAQLDETSLSQNAQFLCSWQVQIHPNIGLQFGEHTQFVKVSSEGYKGNQQQFNHALFGGLSFSGKSVFINLSARQEIRKSQWTPIGIGFTGLFYAKWFNMQVLANKVYRPASYNDLYWIPGGNQNLKSESGYILELGISTKSGKTAFPTFGISGYSKLIQNWIQWVPTGSIWVPFNAKTVQAIGLEASLKENLEFRKCRLQIGTGIHFNQTSPTASYTNGETVGLQLIYVPQFKSNSFVSFAWKGYFLSIDAVVNGKTFSSTDHSTSLPAWYTLNVTVAKSFLLFKTMELQASFSANNATNSNYQTVEQRPMPGFNLLAGIQIKYSFKNQHTL